MVANLVFDGTLVLDGTLAVILVHAKPAMVTLVLILYVVVVTTALALVQAQAGPVFRPSLNCRLSV